MCFVHKPMQNADFGQILCRRASTKRHVTSRPTVRFFANLVSKDAQDLKEKSHEKACRDLRLVARQSRISCRGGGVKLTPPQLR